MTHTYLLKFLHPEDNQIYQGLFKTETSRTSKLMNKLKIEFKKKYNMELEKIEDFQVFKLQK